MINETPYDPANMIALRILTDRIRALGKLYYEHYGDHTNHVDWYHEPTQWMSSDQSDIS
jgi:hypothetical protein